MCKHLSTDYYMYSNNNGDDTNNKFINLALSLSLSAAGFTGQLYCCMSDEKYIVAEPWLFNIRNSHNP